MYLLKVAFDGAQAQEQIAELLTMGDSPDSLAERLGTPLDFEAVREAVKPPSFKRLMEEIDRLQKFIHIDREIEKLGEDKSMLRFLGSGFKEKQLARLNEERRKLGPAIDSPRWFYRQPRVCLLSSIRDFALDHSRQGEASWVEEDEAKLVFPIATIFENADRDGAQILMEEIEKPLKNISPRFLLESFEGHRSLNFDFENGVVFYYAPTAGHST